MKVSGQNKGHRLSTKNLFRQSSFPSVDKCEVIHKKDVYCVLHTRKCISEQNWVKNWHGTSLKDEASVTTSGLGYYKAWVQNRYEHDISLSKPPKILKALGSSP